MKRIEIIDGLRGYFLVFMLINHLVLGGGHWFTLINHRQIAFVEDAQGFVFLSGLLIGMVYTRKMQRGGFAVGAGTIWRRAGVLYLHSLAIIAFILTLLALLPGAGIAWQDWLWDLSWSNLPRVAMAGLLLFQPSYMEILPQYIVYMLAAPPLVWLCLKGRWQFVLLGSGLVWLATQFGVQRPAMAAADEGLKAVFGGGMRAYFNMLGWQLVFFTAMVFGVLTATNKVEWRTIFRPDRTFIPWAGLLVCLFFLPFRYALSRGLLPEAVYASFSPYESRADFGVVYLLNFVAAASGLAWVLIAGPEHRSVLVRRLAAGLEWLFSRSFLRLIGRHSLQVYVWHIVIVYLVRYVDYGGSDFHPAIRTAIVIGGIALLALPALWRERDRGKDLSAKAAPVPAALRPAAEKAEAAS